MRQSRRLHAVATTLMAVFAIIALFCALVFVTVRWPGETGRFVKVALVGAVIGFVASAWIAMLAAAGDTSGTSVDERREE